VSSLLYKDQGAERSALRSAPPRCSAGGPPARSVHVAVGGLRLACRLRCPALCGLALLPDCAAAAPLLRRATGAPARVCSPCIIEPRWL